VEALFREDAIDHAPLLQLLDGQLTAEHEEVVGPVHAHALREGDGGPALRHETERVERHLEVGAFGREDDVRDAFEPGGAGADAGAV